MISRSYSLDKKERNGVWMYRLESHAPLTYDHTPWVHTVEKAAEWAVREGAQAVLALHPELTKQERDQFYITRSQLQNEKLVAELKAELP